MSSPQETECVLGQAGDGEHGDISGRNLEVLADAENLGFYFVFSVNFAHFWIQLSLFSPWPSGTSHAKLLLLGMPCCFLPASVRNTSLPPLSLLNLVIL